jgi:hypothetical protein
MEGPHFLKISRHIQLILDITRTLNPEFSVCAAAKS